MNEDNEQAGTCDHGSWSLRGERLARVRALGCVAGETDKPKDYEPTLEYSFFRSTARLSVEEVIFRGAVSASDPSCMPLLLRAYGHDGRGGEMRTQVERNLLG